jgi:hypothetical protein
MRIPRVRKGIPSQPITYLWERQREIARRLVVGDRQCDIARDLNMTPGRMSIICNSTIFKKYLGSISERREEKACDISEKIRKGAELGVTVLYDALSSNDAHISLKAKIAQDFLDREGHGKVSTVKTEVTHVLTAGKIEELKRLRAERLRSITYEPTIEAVMA